MRSTVKAKKTLASAGEIIAFGFIPIEEGDKCETDKVVSPEYV